MERLPFQTMSVSLGAGLYYGDNLDVLRRYVRDESVDLVYLDPPFNSAKDYNVLFSEHDGNRSAAQVKASKDTRAPWMMARSISSSERGGDPGAASTRAASSSSSVSLREWRAEAGSSEPLPNCLYCSGPGRS